ncbi:LysR substrate-binding domain-containing protein [Eleftheria terrae]|uniref:LysR substrate-binding domain-containing protein n=1 Tax=Eleftheria terrae TaxID=1597781 RepID=UPI00263A6362|nr:LysR substrate-binding domain-containing protein [Eleftheria terrae]WKB55694.1 LysR substrate-binding domain-containing protein [Eleftheria terrae]
MRVRGRFSTDNGEQANDWALAGLGLVRRSVWDVATELADGRLQEVLPQWVGEAAPIQAVFLSRRFLPARTRLLLDQLVQAFASPPQPAAQPPA